MERSSALLTFVWRLRVSAAIELQKLSGSYQSEAAVGPRQAADRSWPEV
jgi:hypothetical protein